MEGCQDGRWCRDFVYMFGSSIQCVVFTALLTVSPMHPTFASDFLGEKYPLYIIPERDITLEYGKPFEALCFLNTSHDEAANRNASNMAFTSNRHTYLNQSILNETGITLSVPNLELGETLFLCKLDLSDGLPVIRPISVAVGELPKPVENFTCYSPNWEKLVCHWNTPLNHIKTEYRGCLVLKGRAGRNPIVCNDEEVKNNTCTFSDKKYHKAHDKFTFLLNGTNVLGSNVQNFPISNYDVVIPNPPENVQIIDRTSYSCLIRWKMPDQVHLLPVGLSFVVQVKSSWEDSWETLKTSSIIIKSANYSYNITNLKFAGAAYDIRISLKSPNNTRSSEPAVKICNTKPARPSAPPKTTAGCYDRAYNPDPILNIYWKALDAYLRNGENFSYQIQCIRDNIENCSRHITEKTSTYAKFNLPLTGSYNFSIFSSNQVGLSENFSSVYVPLLEDVPAPLRPVKMTFGEGAYGITWSHATERVPHQYTVFYCEDEKERPLPCKGLISWLQVAGDKTAQNITVKNKEKFHHFGVSAEYSSGVSSGISWATCVVSPDADLTITELSGVAQSRTAQVTWQLGCAERSPLAGFRIYYCLVGFSEDSNICEGKDENLTITDSHARNTTITNLKPYTTYVVEMSVINEAGIEGRKSSPRRFSTLEDAPDPPTNLRANNITHSSVNLTWTLPNHKNGVILRYYLHTRKSTKRIEVQDKNNIDVSYQVTDLNSLTTYEFTLEACTQANCSEKSLPCQVTTRMDKPDMMYNPRIDIFNRTALNVSWSPPNSLSPSHIYEIEVNNLKIVKNFNCSGDSAVVSIDEFCTTYINEIQFRIRAINIDGEYKILKSNWSMPTTYRCDTANGDFILVLLCIVILSFVVTSGLCTSFLVKQGYVNCKEMKDVAIKLPSGLEPPQDLEKNAREIWPPTYRNNEHEITKITSNGSDEETLLTKIPQIDEKFKPAQYPGSSSECRSLDDACLECNSWDIVSSTEEQKSQTKSEILEADVIEETDILTSPNLLPGYSLIGGSGTGESSINNLDGYITLGESGKMFPSTQKQTKLTYVKAPPHLIAKTPNDVESAASGDVSTYVRNCQPPSEHNPSTYLESSFINSYPILSNDEYTSEFEDSDTDHGNVYGSIVATLPAVNNYVPHQVLKP